MKRAYAKRRVRHKPQPSDRGARGHDASRHIQLPLDRDELLAWMQDSLDNLAIQVGLLVATNLLEDEVARLCGARYQHQPDRTYTRYGCQGGVVTLAGQKLPIERPRVRHADGGSEVPLETYTQLQSPGAMPQAALRRMVRSVRTHNY